MRPFPFLPHSCNNYRTFESIDNYYNYEVKTETAASILSGRPSNDAVLEKEYIVKCLIRAFDYYSGQTIIARRANDMGKAEEFYDKTLRCYSFLKTEISDLNILFLERNAGNYSRNRATVSTIMQTSILLMVLSFSLAIVLVYIMVSSITQPLTEIAAVAHQVEQRDFDIPLFNRQTSDEIGDICRAFDGMIISIRQYVDTIWEKAMKENELRENEIEMRALYTDAHLRALQNQIKPHFLFNTLNTGAQLAMMEDADKTCYFLEQVAEFLRSTIQQPGWQATIDSELGIVDNFIYIMKVRFGNRFEFIRDIPEESFPNLIPRMVLQPLVENCITHGLHNVAKGGKITLKVRRGEDSIRITISDNGCGFPADIRSRILADINSGEISESVSAEMSTDPETHTGTGLVNVISRLKLYYSRTDVFDITDNQGEPGTTFVIRIPYV